MTPAAKTATAFRKTANPRRTTLTRLADATGLVTAQAPEYRGALPIRTANPRRTQL
ncbi:hypothetical protein [Streptomyces montanisoli]|uniref:Uncharacterized protein n=1 Tax=Streptomyces montanisoli TaxID=2798581 RepID=A0A940MLI4_9ACTN|nr:hypothetical protein [Streptomyces montanisoli]MBP0460653.1 hypothetical protein [Streptomyces montanisoli]